MLLVLSQLIASVESGAVIARSASENVAAHLKAGKEHVGLYDIHVLCFYVWDHRRGKAKGSVLYRHHHTIDHHTNLRTCINQDPWQVLNTRQNVESSLAFHFVYRDCRSSLVYVQCNPRMPRMYHASNLPNGPAHSPSLTSVHASAAQP